MNSIPTSIYQHIIRCYVMPEILFQFMQKWRQRNRRLLLEQICNRRKNQGWYENEVDSVAWPDTPRFLLFR
jgi:hypothetical protein